MKTACLWSGGKDSGYALRRAQTAGYEVTALITFVEGDALRSRSHGIAVEVIRRQSEAVGIPLKVLKTSRERFEDDFKAMVEKEKRRAGWEALVFGDIHLEEHRVWIERFCRELEMQPLLPLWGRPSRALAEEMIAEGWKAVVVSLREGILPDEWLGKPFDRRFLEGLPKGVDPCGETGEFHTFLYDGPIFRTPLPFHRGPRRREAGHLFLEVLVEDL